MTEKLKHYIVRQYHVYQIPLELIVLYQVLLVIINAKSDNLRNIANPRKYAELEKVKLQELQSQCSTFQWFMSAIRWESKQVQRRLLH